MPDIPEWEERKILFHEKDTVGFYISGHPLDDAINEINTVTDCSIHNLVEWGDEQPVLIGGLIRSCKKLRKVKKVIQWPFSPWRISMNRSKWLSSQYLRPM